MSLLVIGLSHKTAPLEIREKLALEETETEPFLKALLPSEDIAEAMLLSTCNRVEAYVVAKKESQAQSHIEKLLREKFLEKSQNSETPSDSLTPYLYVKQDQEAVLHILRVTAGLDSLVVGETQITKQVKDAHAQAMAARTSGSHLNRLIQHALRVSKRIRLETEIGRHPVSVSYVSVLLAQKIFGDLRHTKVLLIGAGETGTLAARHLKERKVSELWIANRTEEKSQKLAVALGGVAISFDRINEKLGEADIVMTSVSSSGYLIDEDAVRAAMEKRKNRAMFFIDMAVPRNVNPRLHALENIYLYDIDHLQDIVDANRKERERESRKADEIIVQEAALFAHQLSQHAASPTIQQLSEKFERIRSAEVQKILSKNPSFSETERETLEGCTRAIVNKILHDPILSIKGEHPSEDSSKYTEMVKKLFRLDS